MEHDLIEFEVLNVDTVKIRANASYKQFRNYEGIEKEQAKLKERIAELLEKANCDDDEQRVLSTRQKKLENAKNELHRRIEKKSKNASVGKQIKIEAKERINITDHDCGLMQQANGEKNSAYAVTMATDSANDFITYVDVQERLNDPDALMPAIDGSRETTGKRHDVVNADAGFASMDNLENLEKDNQIALIPDRRIEAETKKETSKGKYDRSQFVYKKRKDC